MSPSTCTESSSSVIFKTSSSAAQRNRKNVAVNKLKPQAKLPGKICTSTGIPSLRRDRSARPQEVTGRLGNETYWCRRVETGIECPRIVVIGGHCGVKRAWVMREGKEGGNGDNTVQYDTEGLLNVSTRKTGSAAIGVSLRRCRTPLANAHIVERMETIDSRDSEPTGREEWRNDAMSVGWSGASSTGKLHKNQYDSVLDHGGKDTHLNDAYDNQYDSGIWIMSMQWSVDHGSKDTHLADNAVAYTVIYDSWGKRAVVCMGGVLKNYTSDEHFVVGSFLPVKVV
ncbi:hypothetical protein EDD15DRAFT_2201264 [Pisolithus albus]|nr:hypothetical protein EDD15DRAFT_2201264 [Pisolithus albus]